MDKPLALPLVTQAGALRELAAELRKSDWFALDTEFIREKTYYPRLALVQVATDDVIACIDPLALDGLEPLLELLYEPGIVKVLHAARQDQELFFNLTGKAPAPVFDTQVAAALAGWPDQVGYGTLVKDIAGVELDKSHARTDWMQRPLPDEALSYAADDVRYLGRVYRHLHGELARRGRLEWIAEDLAQLSEAGLYTARPGEAWRRVKGTQKLKPKHMRVLAELAAWREETAMHLDRPRQWLVRDEVLVDVARRQPADRESLLRIRGAADSALKRHANEVLERVAAARDMPPLELPEQRERLTPEEEAQVDLLMAVVRQAGAEQAISPANLATRKELARLVAGDPDVNVLKSWRRKAVGEALQALLRGEAALRIRDGRLTLDASS